MIQPFIENTIWHGIAPKAGDGKISVSISKQNKSIVFTVSDYGVGMKASSNKRNHLTHQSHGVNITASRMRVLSRIGHAEAGIQYSEANPGTVVIIKLPFREKF